MEVFVIAANQNTVETLESIFDGLLISTLDMTETWPEKPGMTGMYVEYDQENGDMSTWGYLGMCLTSLFKRGHLRGLKMIKRDQNGAAVRTKEEGFVTREVYEKIKSQGK